MHNQVHKVGESIRLLFGRFDEIYSTKNLAAHFPMETVGDWNQRTSAVTRSNEHDFLKTDAVFLSQHEDQEAFRYFDYVAPPYTP